MGGLCGFAGKEGAFAGFAPTVALDDAGFPNNAMARDEPGKGIRTASGTDGPNGVLMTDCPGDAAVSSDAALGYAEEGAPDFQLERSGADKSRQRDGVGVRIENVFGDAAGGTVIAGEIGMRPVSAEIGGDAGFMRNIVKGDVADAARIPTK